MQCSPEQAVILLFVPVKALAPEGAKAIRLIY
jgi:hypothetical protein